MTFLIIMALVVAYIFVFVRPSLRFFRHYDEIRTAGDVTWALGMTLIAAPIFGGIWHCVNLSNYLNEKHGDGFDGFMRVLGGESRREKIKRLEREAKKRDEKLARMERDLLES